MLKGKAHSPPVECSAPKAIHTMSNRELDDILRRCKRDPVPITGTPHDLIDVLPDGRVLLLYREWDRDSATIEMGFGTADPDHAITQHPVVRERGRRRGGAT